MARRQTERLLQGLPKDVFFAAMERQQVSLTYDDVRLRSGESNLMPAEVDLETRFSRNVPLRIPIVSAAMDTVTEDTLAIALAQLGGLGIIHRGLSAEEQASQVVRVKYHLNGRIEKPICVQETDPIEQILMRRDERRFRFHTFPVLNGEGKLTGILTENDFDFCEDTKLLAREVMTRDPITVSSADGLTVQTAYDKMMELKKKVLPVIDELGIVVGLYIFSDVKARVKGSTAGYNLDNRGQLRVGAAIGTSPSDLERAQRLVEKNVDVLVIDTAHGDSAPVYSMLRELKRIYESVDIVVGNVSEPQSARRLLNAGADGIKVGQGPGSICTTRIVAGIGCPQVTAIYECSKALRGSDVPICADGGLKHPGDIPIALGAGAYSVMMGSMLAATHEAPGEIIHHEGRQWKGYRGMGSEGAMKDSAASRERYRQAEGKTLVPEGVEAMVPYKGPLAPVIAQYIGGLRAGMGYVGAANIDELQRIANFRRLTGAGIAESHVHDVTMIKEPANYKKR